jgi:Domain of unknown function (DUF4864)
MTVARKWILKTLKFIGLVCIVASAAIALDLWVFSKNVKRTVDGQLSSLRARQLSSAYYNYTSQEFQEATSFEDFKEFVSQHPILANNTDAVFNDKTIDNGLAFIRALLLNRSKLEAEVLYNLIRENFAWKIHSMQLTALVEGTAQNEESVTSTFITPIETQLKALQNNDAYKAYYDLVSKQFESEMPFDKFKIFVIQHPILTEFTHFDFKEHSINKEVGLVTVILNPEKEAVSIKYQLIEEKGKWKIQRMLIDEPTKDTENAETLSPMISTVEKQLEMLREHDFDKAYQDFLSEDIKAKTPISLFKRFILNYPPFYDYQSMNIKEPLIENDLGRVLVELISEEGPLVVEYTLKLQDNQWKIQGMHIDQASIPLDLKADSQTKGLKTRDLVVVIQGFLEAVRQKDIPKAYQQFTSKNFQQTNSLKDFEEFIANHPEFVSTSSSSFEKLMFNNNIATFSCKLILSDKVYLPVEFDLLLEGNTWKILHIFTYPIEHEQNHEEQTNEASSGVPLEFEKAVFGTSIDEEGNITNPAVSFESDSGDIYMNLFILHGVIKTQIAASLRHVNSGSETPAVSMTLNDSGDTLLSFVFSPPSKKWPKGAYQIRVSSSTKLFKTYTFTVE